MLLAFVTLTSARGLLCALQVVSAWSVGYALTWASKWALAVAWGVPWKEIAEVILFRLDGDYGDTISHHLLAPSLKVATILVSRYCLANASRGHLDHTGPLASA
jgi:hypothetical protein